MYGSRGGYRFGYNAARNRSFVVATVSVFLAVGL